MDIRKSWIVEKPIAHRGLHNAEAPENSLEAFGKAIENGFAIELDVRLTDDGEVVVFHDDSLTRMTSADGYMSNITADGVKSLRLLGTECTVPTFAETLEFVAGRAPILIETKNTGKVGDLESKTLQLLSGYKGEVAVQSFNPYSMEYFKTNAPAVMRGQLSTFFEKGTLPFSKRFLLKRLKLNGVSKPDFISYGAEFLPNRYVTKTGLPVLAWTVRSNAEMESVLPYCDNIIFEKFIPKMTANEE
ncbi:MAG: glycerophosphodiester phosphodiesterase [Clostridiales bacterium]|jgi:glycerophosphoryl diester phosphodiesterase|nr:glycerophosphodiester phosphodiesterase [Clostridiales bacterium]